MKATTDREVVSTVTKPYFPSYHTCPVEPYTPPSLLLLLSNTDNTTRSAEHLNPTSQFNTLTPNDLYISRTTPLTSKRCILYIYSTNVGTEYFKHALYSPFFLFKMQFVS